jgi:hypothetical protein
MADKPIPSGAEDGRRKVRRRRPSRGRHLSAPTKKALFLEELRKHGTVYHAAQAADVGRRTVYQWREKDAEFAAAWSDAHEDALDALEESLYRRGITRDTTAAIFLLKGNRPEKFHDRHAFTGKDGGPIEIATWSALIGSTEEHADNGVDPDPVPSGNGHPQSDAR